MIQIHLRDNKFSYGENYKDTSTYRAYVARDMSQLKSLLVYIYHNEKLKAVCVYNTPEEILLQSALLFEDANYSVKDVKAQCNHTFIAKKKGIDNIELFYNYYSSDILINREYPEYFF